MGKASLRTLLPALKGTPYSGKFTHLRPDLILSTVDKLERRVGERFPDSGLRQVCAEFCGLAARSAELARQLHQPIWIVRVGVVTAATLLVGLALWAFIALVSNFSLRAEQMPDLVQTTEAAINELIFLGLALFTLVSVETRLKRQAALKALHQLRSIAHVVDMHQLTKDPAYLLSKVNETETSPERVLLTRVQLTRYLDYCSELLALIAKIAALFGQNMDDPVVLSAVNDIEQLAQSLSAKIWQKIMILDLAEDTDS